LQWDRYILATIDKKEISDGCAQRSDEPPLIERARRTGWALLMVALLAAVGGRMMPDWRVAALAVAAVAGAVGVFAIVNVALVRSRLRRRPAPITAYSGYAHPDGPQRCR
jgi:hypothetical protein